MSSTTHYLACDLGAESGRLMLGSLDGQQLTLEEIHRFENKPLRIDGALTWNIPELFEQLKCGLKKAAARHLRYSSLSTDSWGVDYLLFDARGEIIPPAFHYRDSRTKRGMASALARIDWKTIFAETGIQFMPLNTLFQLAAELPQRLVKAHQLLLIGDGFNFLLSGVARAEVSLASTSQLYHPVNRDWSCLLLERLGFPREIFPPIVPAGTVIGQLRSELARETGLHALPIIASCSHDTGAAVAAVPAQGSDWAYISSGTWSLMGAEISEPILNDLCRELNFTNEIGYGNTVRLLKNIIGLWLVQECRRSWTRTGQNFDYHELTEMAAQAPPFVSLIDPTDERFLNPEEMPAAIAGYCRETNQPEPKNPGATIRCALESLALLYRKRLRELEQLLGRKIGRIHVVGGGSKNDLLNEFTANACEVPILAGPVEATAAGNILVQAIALGHIGSLSDARAIVEHSFSLRRFAPCETTSWRAANERFEALLQRKSAIA
ncbi:MAG: rhamnulokinase family protein [Verrucomicrobiota bacterium]